MDKVCARCGVSKGLGAFRDAAPGKGDQFGKFPYCMPCQTEYGRAWKANNAERVRAQAAARRYDLSLEEYLALVERANGLCECCGKPSERLSVEHNHRTGKVRGLVCQRCNIAIGVVEDPERLRNAQRWAYDSAG